MLDEKAFSDALMRRSDMLYHIAKTILSSDEDCRDALQDAALRAWEKRRQLRDDGLFDAWITRILINCCHAIGRKRRRLILQEDIDTGSAPPPDRELYHALTSLPEAYRLPLVLHYLEGMDYAQTARALGISQSAVRGRLSRGRTALKKWFEEEV